MLIQSTSTYMHTIYYLGLSVQHKQIKSSCSETGRYIISGSEDGKVYIWSKNNNEQDTSENIYTSLHKVQTEKKVEKSGFSLFSGSASKSGGLKDHNYESFDPYPANSSGDTPAGIYSYMSVFHEYTLYLLTILFGKPVSHTYAMYAGTVATTVALFGPSASLISSKTIANNIQSNKYTPTTATTATATADNTIDTTLIDHNDIAAYTQDDLSTRIIVVANENGQIAVFLRGV